MCSERLFHIQNHFKATISKNRSNSFCNTGNCTVHYLDVKMKLTEHPHLKDSKTKPQIVDVLINIPTSRSYF